MLTHPLSGEKCRREITLAQGRSSSIIVYAHAKSQTYYRKACSEHALQTGFSFEFSRGFLVYGRHNGRSLGKGHGRESAYTSAFLPDARIHSAKHFCLRAVGPCEDIRRFFCVFDQWCDGTLRTEFAVPPDTDTARAERDISAADGGIPEGECIVSRDGNLLLCLCALRTIGNTDVCTDAEIDMVCAQFTVLEQADSATHAPNLLRMDEGI